MSFSAIPPHHLYVFTLQPSFRLGLCCTAKEKGVACASSLIVDVFVVCLANRLGVDHLRQLSLVLRFGWVH